MDILRSYYFERHHARRILITLLAMAILCAAAYVVSYAVTTSPDKTVIYWGLIDIDSRNAELTVMGVRISLDFARFIAYLLFLLVLITSEVVLAAWREKMRNDLYNVRDQLVRLDFPV